MDIVEDLIAKKLEKTITIVISGLRKNQVMTKQKQRNLQRRF